MKKILIFVLLIFTAVLSGQKPVYYLMKGKALVETGNPDEAISVLTSALTLVPETKLYLERAEAYLAKGDYSGAISDFNSANNHGIPVFCYHDVTAFALHDFCICNIILVD